MGPKISPIIQLVRETVLQWRHRQSGLSGKRRSTPRSSTQCWTSFASVMSSTPPTLLSRCGNSDVEHAHYYSSLHSAVFGKPQQKYISIVCFLCVKQYCISTCNYTSHKLVPYHFYNFCAAPVLTCTFTAVGLKTGERNSHLTLERSVRYGYINSSMDDQ